ncbi:ATP synthase F0 subunit B [Pseudobutyrivibrio xylanivorans]|uniref:ATP synthase subunit b n=1 Tax=Pseudobutyrivibrio xylanivorans TaxID=185007 RepID=A0A5P6VUB4_PSEXY|nr:ATP synthase F0 subunit B [Pseudobutyrivibrio xylanivorans]QFJ54431.1 ATP synthase F0 subunit B [Pseudobutyrivibrio xylanivorans]
MINISFWNILWTVINLLILFVAMKLVFFKPIAKTIEKRQEEANDVIDKAVTREKEAKQLAQEYQDKLDSVEEQKKQIIAEARKTADGQYQQIVSTAKDDAKSIRDNAVVEAYHEKEKIIASAKKEIAEMVLDATTKVIGSKAGAAVDSELFDDFLDKAGE